MEKNKQKNKNITFSLNDVLTITLIVVVVSPIVTYTLVHGIHQLIVLLNWNNLVEGDSNAWISFSGSLIGGFMTMLAIIITLKFDDIKRKEEKKDGEDQRRYERALAILPLLKCQTKTQHGHFYESLEQFKDFTILNISSNHCSKLRLTKVDVYWMEPAESHPGSYDIIHDYSLDYEIPDNLVDVSLLPSGSDHTFRLYLPEPHDPEELIKTRNPGINCLVKLHFVYQDILGIYTYDHEYMLILSQDINPKKSVSINNHTLANYKIYNEINEFEIQSE